MLISVNSERDTAERIDTTDRVPGVPLWYGGTAAHLQADPTRVVQGIVTGVGFLCAGVIMKDGLNISGLTTAASSCAG